MKKILSILQTIILVVNLFGQQYTQNIRGKVNDKISAKPLEGVNVVIKSNNFFKGTTTDSSGIFIINDIPIGRYDVLFSYIGYENITLKEILITTGKELFLDAEMEPTDIKLNDIIIRSNKNKPSNSMASLNARQINMEQARRFAGGYDDPARLVSSYAGVAGNVGNNGIVIRGNSPKGIHWRLEEIEITNPSHFANLVSLGAGGITALSSQVISSIDFYTGAFPAEFGNALSGVFDIKFKNGNPLKKEYSFQLGLTGIDISAEGPFIKNKPYTYIFNYRYALFSIIAPILPPEMGSLNYQDVNYKLYFPLRKNIVLSIWGIGLKDFQGRKAITDSLKWKSSFDKEEYSNNIFMGCNGVTTKFFFNKSVLSMSLALYRDFLNLNIKSLDKNLVLIPQKNIKIENNNYIANIIITKKFNNSISNRTGFIFTNMKYNLHISKALENNLSTLSEGNGNTSRIQFFSQTKINTLPDLTINSGIHYMFFFLNNKYSIEPRASIEYNFNSKNNICFSYGLHSKIEMLNYYYTKINTDNGFAYPNKNLGFTKAHHFIITYSHNFSENLSVKIEPYYQYIFNVPIVPKTYISLLNSEFRDEIYFNDSLINKGIGQNIGIDVSFEKYLSKGSYFLITGSLFNSKYRNYEEKLRNTPFNRNYIFNFSGGKEWYIGKNKNNILNINIKYTFMGGKYLIPVKEDSSIIYKTILLDHDNAYSIREPNGNIFSFSIIYRKNKKNYSTSIVFSWINVFGYPEFTGYYYDELTNSIKKDINKLVIPLLAYKVDF